MIQHLYQKITNVIINNYHYLKCGYHYNTEAEFFSIIITLNSKGKI